MKVSFFVLSGLLIMQSASAQPGGTPVTPLSLSYGKMIDWYSPVVRDSFRTYVFLPPGYDTSSTRYPLLYLTDGDWLFTTAVGALGNLKQDYQVSEPIIIATGYGDRENKRYRDLDPDQGGAAFLRAIKEELMPWVQAHFRVNDDQSLYGYSMGGKFATFALFNEPQLFSSVMIGAPADGGTHLMPTAKKFAQNLSAIKTTRLFLGVGEYEHETVDHINKFVQWCQKQLPCVQLTTYTALKMNHGAAISAVLQEALRVNFATLQKEITLPVVTLQQYAGAYQLDSDRTIANKVFVRGGKLWIELQGYENKYPLQLHAAGKDRFFLKEFERNTYLFKGRRLQIMLPDGRILNMNK